MYSESYERVKEVVSRWPQWKIDVANGLYSKHRKKIEKIKEKNIIVDKY